MSRLRATCTNDQCVIRIIPRAKSRDLLFIMSTVSRSLTRASCHYHVNPPYSPFRLRTAFYAKRTRSLHAGRSMAPPQGGVSVGTVFTALAVVGVTATAYGVYILRHDVLFYDA